MKQYRIRRLFIGLTAIIMIMGIWFIGQRKICRTKVHVPVESTEILPNPMMGTYHIYQFRLGQDDTEAARDLVTAATSADGSLCLLEIDLENYRDGDLPEEALEQTDQILSAFRDGNKKLILRFLYDWNGMAALTEPDSLDVILRHMEQLGPILLNHQDRIFMLQGLFTGNWGEMNGSRYADSDSIRLLAAKLQEVTQHKILLSVRTPAQWRIILDVNQDSLTGNHLDKLASASGVALFNDGLTGTGTDYGTYASDTEGIYESHSDQDMKKIDFKRFDPQKPWPRDPELLFQEKICTWVPNGGEAIHLSEWNDLSQTLRSFRRMHITYLNRDYDKDVWNKWASERVHTKDAFDGISGDSYIAAHLGYRYVLKDAEIRYSWTANRLSAIVTLQNKGFAPAYEPLMVHLMLVDATGNPVREQKISLDPVQLPGGNEAQRTRQISAAFSAAGLSRGRYAMTVKMTDSDGRTLYLGNQEEQKDALGQTFYSFGTVDINE